MIQLPTLPRGAAVKPKLVRYGGDLVSSLGGPTQRITRPGTRYATEITLPSLDAACAARWIGAFLAADAAGDTVGLVLPQTIDPGQAASGASGNGQAGTPTINIMSGATAIPSGLWLSISVGGRHYLHQVTGHSGSALSVAPLLRATFSSAPLNFATPILEGYPDDAPAWDIEWFRFTSQSFTLTENA